MRTIFNINSVTVASLFPQYMRSFPDILNYFNSFSESKGLQQLETDFINFQ